MQLKNSKLVLLTLLMMFNSSPSYAFKVSKMLLLGDQNGNGIITLSNDESRPLFINTEIEELTFDNGVGVKKLAYSKDNVSDWKISLTHQKLVLQPGESKDIGIRSLCHNTTCDNSKDLMFMLSFIPSTYKEANDKKSGVEVNYGFAPVYIIPTTEPTFDYDLTNHGETLEVDNRSNTIIDVLIDNCDSNVTRKCRQKVSVLAGRNKTFKLTDLVQGDVLNLIVSSRDDSYSKSYMVKRSK